MKIEIVLGDLLNNLLPEKQHGLCSFEFVVAF